MGKLQNYIMTTSLENHMDSNLPILVNYASAAVLGMLSGLLVEWIKGGYNETPEEFIELVLKIIKYPTNLYNDKCPISAT